MAFDFLEERKYTQNYMLKKNVTFCGKSTIKLRYTQYFHNFLYTVYCIIVVFVIVITIKYLYVICFIVYDLCMLALI